MHTRRRVALLLRAVSAGDKLGLSRVHVACFGGILNIVAKNITDTLWKICWVQNFLFKNNTNNCGRQSYRYTAVKLHTLCHII